MTGVPLTASLTSRKWKECRRMPSEGGGVSAEAEYAALRAEIERRSTVQQALLVLYLTAVGAIVSLAFKSGVDVGSLRSTRSYFLALLIPYTGLALARLWLDHHEAVLRIGGYIRTALEPRSDASWETFLHTKGRSTRLNHNLFFLAYGTVFVVPGVVAVGAAFEDTQGWERWLTWASALLLVALNGYGWAHAWWRETDPPISFARLRTIFEPRVRAKLDWDRLAALKDVTVVEYFVDDRSDYEGWWTPWYFRTDSAGERVEVQERDGGRAIRLLDCGTLPERGAGEWASKAQSVSQFEATIAGAPAKFDVCVYAVRGGRGETVGRIILDGNHHLAAALRSGRIFLAHVFEIRNGPPDDRRVLPDLGRRWSVDGARPRPNGAERDEAEHVQH